MSEEYNPFKLQLDTPLRADEIEFRIQSINKGGYATILAYKTARTDAKRLTDVFGGLGWQKSYSRDNKNCTISVWDDERKHWVSKENTGTESNTEQQKGLASDSFKRAGFDWRIGAELYDYPIISIKLNPDEVDLTAQPRPKQTWNLKLKEWKWYNEFDDGLLTMLLAKDEKGNHRFSYKIEMPKFRFKKGEKDEVLARTFQALSDGDEVAIRSIMHEFDSPESQMAYFSLFNSRERSSIKAYLNDDK